MCGIAGYAGFDDEVLLRSMCDSISHRGPDADGFFVAPGIGLGMRRLAIIDLKTGQQPIANETQTVWVVFNGEIYNYEELRAELIARGHSFRTTSDTETIVHLYEEHGLDFLQHLRGMFAIALWDTRLRRLVLARDRVGEKPLFWSCPAGKLLFGSEIKTILQARGSREVDRQAVCDYLAASYVPRERTFYQSIRKLPPGHMLVWEEGRATLRRYYGFKQATTRRIPFEEAQQRLAEELNESVRLCLKSDVEVGAFLSGGLDSSTIVALMRRHSVKVQTFSIGYAADAAGFSELGYAKRVAQLYGTDHHELILDAYETVDMLPRILWHYDEPHGEPTSILVYQLCEFTRRRLKVALGGTGGDELFFGYPRHKGIRLLQLYRLLPRIVRKHLVERVVARWPESTTGSRFAKRARRFVLNSEAPSDQAYLSWVSLLQPEVRADLLSGQMYADCEDAAGDSFLRDYLIADQKRELLDRAADLDIEGYLPEYQLAYMDRMSMAHGLEVRSPFCDYRLVEYVRSLPAAYRLHGTRSKHILKEVATEWLPSDIVNRSKVGFDSPIGQWFKGKLRSFLDNFLSTDQLEKSGLLNPSAVRALMSDHFGGKRDYSLQLWSVLALEAWFRMYIEDRVVDGRNYTSSDLRGAPKTEALSVLNS
ncbi:MAG TPA: asparagine synthase (glutamine-hydrolyzing) [Clostridia bacterium]|nr:asparagine synthase (glutamine-hydrolyzing) [Clostridia bacterium]